MKTAREFAKQFQRPDIIGQRCIGGADIEARDREVRAAALRELADVAFLPGLAAQLRELADRAERGP